MENDDEDVHVTVGISIPVNPSEENRCYVHNQQCVSAILSAQDNEYNYESSETHLSSQFNNLHSSMDPNLGMLDALTSVNIPYEIGTFNSWNIDPYFLQILPLSSTDIIESSVLLFGGISPSSVSNKELLKFDHEDFVLGSTVFQYLLKSAQWKYYGTMIEPRCYHTSVLLGQLVYIIGGYSLLKCAYGEMLAVSSTDCLNLNDGQWKRCANMITARATHAAVSHKSAIYVFGGRNCLGEILSSVEVYYPDQDVWAVISYLPRPTMGLSAACAMDRIWLLGGITTNYSADLSACLLSDVLSFNPDVKRWTIEEPLPHPCAYSVCISNGHSLWMIGGCTFSKNIKTDSLTSCSSVFRLVMSTRPSKWNIVGSLLNPRHAPTAVLYDESVYILGGMESSGKCTINKAEVFNLITNVSIEYADTPAAITGSASVLIQFDTEDNSFAECYKMFKEPRASSDLLLGDESLSSIDKDLNTSRIGKDLKKNDAAKHVSSVFEESNLGVEESEELNTSKTGNYLKESDTIKHISPFHLKKYLENDIEEPEDSNTSTTEKCIIGSETVKHISSTQENSNLGTTAKDLEYEHIKNLEAHKSINVQSYEDLREKEIHVKLNDTQRKEESDHTLRYRASMEIFLSSIMANRETNLSEKRKSSVTEWQDYFSTFSSSDEKQPKEILKSIKSIDKTSFKSNKEEESSVSKLINDSHSKISTKTEKHQDLLQEHAVSASVPSFQKHSLLCIQSNLKSKSSFIQADTNEILNKKSIHSSSSVKETTELRQSSELDVTSDKTDILISQHILPVILIMGGEDPLNPARGKYILSYECKLNLWKYIGYMPEHRCHHCTVYLRHRFYVIGGFDSENSKEFENITRKLICYDTLNGMWYEKASMNHPRAFHSAVILNDEIWVLGGRDQLGNILTSVEVYNESKDEWREYRPLPYPVLGAAVTVVNDTVYIFGGITYEEENEIISSNIARLEFENNRWEMGLDMHAPLAFCGIASFMNSVWLFGGLKEENEEIVSGKDVLQFDILAETWSKVAELSVPRLAAVAVSLGNKVYIIGGHSTQNKSEVTTCEEMDLLNKEMSLKKPLPVAVSGKAGAIIAEISNSK